MKNNLYTILFLAVSLTIKAQTGSIELSTGGFSFVPAFTSKEPNIIINAGTNPKRRLTGNIMYMARIRSMTPNTVVLITRYKLIDKKFKSILGIHLPAMQLSQDYKVTSFFGQEWTNTYPINDKWNIGSFVLNGRGRNSDIKIRLLAANTLYKKGNLGFFTQAYHLNVNNLVGVAETITYDINKSFQLKGFANYTVTDGAVIGTVGLKYNL